LREAAALKVSLNSRQFKKEKGPGTSLRGPRY
jgi:hypothetical protein